MITPEEKLWAYVAIAFIRDVRDELNSLMSIEAINEKTEKWLRQGNCEYFAKILAISNIHPRLAKKVILDISKDAKTNLRRREKNLDVLEDRLTTI